MKRIMLFLVAMLAMVAILALPAIAQDEGSDADDPNNPYDDYAQLYQDYLDQLEEDLQPYLDEAKDYYDRHPPGYDDRGEPREPDCDWYGPYEERRWDDAWWEYWCYWPHWGWEFVFWTWA